MWVDVAVLVRVAGEVAEVKEVVAGDESGQAEEASASEGVGVDEREAY